MTPPPPACSGAMYRAVPITTLVAVSVVLTSARAMPKSVTVTRPSAPSIRLDGLTSRCTISCWCAACRASSAVASRPRACSGAIGPPSVRTLSSGRPSTSSITM